MTLKIAVDARPLCVPTFGIGRYTRELLGRLIDTPDTMWYLYADRPLMETYADKPNVVRRAASKANHILSVPRTQLGFARWARQDNIDVFWSPRHHLPLCLPRDMKRVVTIHDFVWKRYPETMRAAGLWQERAIMPASLRQADAIICVSQATFEDLVHYYPDVADRAVVVPLAASRRQVTPVTGERYFFFVGTLEPRKNLPRLLEAFAMARQRFSEPCRLYIAGARGWKSDIGNLLARSGAASDVTVLDYIDDDTLHARLAGAIALCLPSLYEGFGLPALEAMQYGTPVIGGNISSIPEVVGEGGILVDPMSVNAIADALVQLASDPALRSDLSIQATQQAARFSWDAAASQTLEILRVLAAPRREPGR